MFDALVVLRQKVCVLGEHHSSFVSSAPHLTIIVLAQHSRFPGGEHIYATTPQAEGNRRWDMLI